VGEPGRRRDDLRRGLRSQLDSQGAALERHPPRRQLGALDTVRRDVARQRQVEEPQRPFGRQRQDVALVAHQGDRRAGQLGGTLHILGARHLGLQGVAVHEPGAVEAEAGLGREKEPHRGVEPPFVDLPFGHSPDDRLDGDTAVAR
jgi:hypothetical protein